MSQYQVGRLKSTPKLVRINADDSNAVIVKNLGNGRRIPLVWATQVTMASGTTEVVVASGVSFSEFECSDAKYFVTSSFTVTSGITFQTTHVGKVYIEKDTTLNMATLKSTASAATQDTIYDILIFLADNASYDATSSNMLWKSSGTNRMG